MGQVRSWSMFKYEWFNSWICRRVTNRANPEATVIKTYQVIEEKHTYHINNTLFRMKLKRRTQRLSLLQGLLPNYNITLQ